jgi:hypothetical protein
VVMTVNAAQRWRVRTSLLGYCCECGVKTRILNNDAECGYGMK